MRNDFESNYLMHHGILGMKWGKKNGPPYPLGESQKSAAEKKSELPNDGNQKPVHNSDGSVTYKKGYKFNRVGGENLQANSSGGLYVSYGKADAARYVKFLGPTLLGKLMGEYGTIIQHLSVTDDLKCISDSSIIKETMQFLKKNPQFLKDVSDSFYSLAFEDLKIDDRSLDAYNDKEKKQINYLVNSLLGDPNYSDLAKSYYGYFRSKGYDAIPDIHDRLSGTGETAIIVINPNKINMTAKTTITKDIMKEAKAFVKSVGDLPIDELLK